MAEHYIHGCKLQKEGSYGHEYGYSFFLLVFSAILGFVKVYASESIRQRRIKMFYLGTSKENRQIYMYDKVRKTVHGITCEKLENISSADVYDKGSLKAAFAKGYKPCSCCKSTFSREKRERNQDIISRSQYNYIFTPTSSVFHKRTCKTMLAASNILGCVKYETARQGGKVPCKICRPSPSDYTVFPKSTVLNRRYVEKQLSIETRRAINRQKEALRERNEKLSNARLTKSQRDDVYALTQPENAFWAGMGYETFHLRNCPKLKNVTNLHGFKTYAEAKNCGYYPCKTCRPSPKQDVKLSIPIASRVREDDKISNLEEKCRNKGYLCGYDNKFFLIETPAGKWKVDMMSMPIKLMHINLAKNPDCCQYHVQPRIFLSFSDIFDYINRHDNNLIDMKSDSGDVNIKKIKYGRPDVNTLCCAAIGFTNDV